MQKVLLLASLVLWGCCEAPDTETVSDDSFSPQARYETAMSELGLAGSERRRFYALPDASMTSFDVGNVAEAREFATELLTIAPKYSSDWNYGNAIHKGNIVLGRLALREGDVVRAEQFLLKAGETPGSPQLNTFGPNMTLAKELLEHGRKESVIRYFQLCGDFWEMDRDYLEFWAFQVKKGKVPYFGAHLLY